MWHGIFSGKIVSENSFFAYLSIFPFGGLQRDFMRIAKLCSERGHDITVYTMEWEGDKPEQFNVKVIASNKLSIQNHRSCRVGGGKRVNAVNA